MKKSLRFIIVLSLVFFISSYVFAGTPVASGDATMKLVEDNVCDISFGKYGQFEKKMTNIDTTNKTIDISLTVSNNQEIPKETKTETIEGLKDAEIVFLVDNSNSMKNNISSEEQAGKVRKDAVLEAASTLVDSIYEKGTNIKMGVVSYAAKTTQAKGTDDDAKIRTEKLVDTKEEVKTAFDAIKNDNDKTDARTDLEAGLDAAEKVLNTSTNKDAKKIIILLTDGVPNLAIGAGPVTNGQGGFTSAYDESIINPTKQKLVDLKTAGIKVYSVLMNLSSTELQYSTMKNDDGSTITERQYAEKIFGSETNPTAGPVYFITDDDITKTITESIFDDLKTTSTKTTEVDGTSYTLNDIVIKDYFPQNIIDNFNFALLTKPDKGEVTATVDKSDNSITWTISELKPNETSTFTYRLSLKNEFDSDIVGINLPTNKDVTIDYKENGEDGPQVHNDKCPIVALDVQSKKEIPQTGSNTWIIVMSLIGAAAVVAVLSFKNYRDNN